MKLKLRSAASLLLLSSLVYAQEIKPNFESLKLNSSPAYILLGVEPENIQRPGTPTAFITGLQNAVSDNKIQPNLAFEISPYYMVAKDEPGNANRFNPSKYLLDHPDVFQNIARTASISIGTSAATEKTFGKLQTGTGLGLGLRFQLISGMASQVFKTFNYDFVKFDALSKLQRMLKIYAAPFNTQATMDEVISRYFSEDLPKLEWHLLSGAESQKLKSELDGLKFEINSKGGTKEDAIKIIEAKTDEHRTVLESATAAMNLKKTPLAKQGFMLEFAAGQAYVFENDAFNSGRHAKSALWLVPSFRWDANKQGAKMSLLDIMFVGRYTFNNQSAGVDAANYLDAGTKFAFTRNKWSVNAEFVYRYATNLPAGFSKNYTYRLVTGADYKITDAITVKFNFGTNFDGNTATYTEAKKLFAVGGINFGMLSFGSDKN